MGNKVFVDTNFIVALFSPEDSLHQQAEKLSKSLSKYTVYLSNYIFAEAVTVLSQRAGKEKALIAGKYLLNKENFYTVIVDEELHGSSWEIFNSVPKKNTSFVDCSTIAVMRAEGISKLLIFDQEDFKPLLQKHHLSLLK